jgi:hypothetical protein
MDYLNFDLMVERAEPGYRVRVDSPMGQALRALAERDILAQAKEAFMAYRQDAISTPFTGKFRIALDSARTYAVLTCFQAKSDGPIDVPRKEDVY